MNNNDTVVLMMIQNTIVLFLETLELAKQAEQARRQTWPVPQSVQAC
jgi:hypothetical protein